MTPWPIARPLPTYATVQTQDKRAQMSVPSVRSELTNPAFVLAKAVPDYDSATTVICCAPPKKNTVY
jgi:hypothetical protein